MSTEEEKTGVEPGDEFVPTDEKIDAALPGEDLGGEQEDGDQDGTLEDAGAEFSAEALAAIAGDDKPKMVPHSRFQEKNDEAKAHRARVLELEEELARAKGAAPSEPPKKEETPAAYDFDDAEDRYQAAFLDGDTSKARQIRAEIRAEERKAAKAEAEQAADQRYQANKAADDAKRTKLEFDLALSKAYAAYPFLNVESGDKNQDAIDETLVWHQHFVGKGKTPAEALELAAAKVGPRYADKKPDPAAQNKIDVQKQLDRAAKIPPKAEGLGARSTKGVDISNMSREEFRKLTPEQRKAFEETGLTA